MPTKLYELYRYYKIPENRKQQFKLKLRPDCETIKYESKFNTIDYINTHGEGPEQICDINDIVDSAFMYTVDIEPVGDIIPMVEPEPLTEPSRPYELHEYYLNDSNKDHTFNITHVNGIPNIGQQHIGYINGTIAIFNMVDDPDVIIDLSSYLSSNMMYDTPITRKL